MYFASLRPALTIQYARSESTFLPNARGIPKELSLVSEASQALPVCPSSKNNE